MMVSETVTTLAERELLGRILLGAAVPANLEPSDFSTGWTTQVFAACGELVAAGAQPDPAAVYAHLAGQVPLAELRGLTGNVTSRENVDYWGMRVRDASRARHLRSIGAALAQAQTPDQQNAALLELELVRDRPTSSRPVAVDWTTFWTDDPGDADWLCAPIAPAGRGIALYGPAKVGKSLLALDVAAAVATGRPVLDRPAGTPTHVTYVDYEMTTNDLRERLAALGYGPADDLTRLHYYVLAPFPPLDTDDGGRQLLDAIETDRSALAIIDTFGRAVHGPENDADTIRAFYACTGAPIKRAGTGWLRVDHTGHSHPDRARGSSGKGDDVDLHWSMSHEGGNRYRLRSTSRVPWVPPTVTVHREDNDGQIRHRLVHDAWPAGTIDCAADLDRLGLDADTTRRDAADALRADGCGRRLEVVGAALHYRRQVLRGGTP